MGKNETKNRRCWKSESTFKRFYAKGIINENNLDELNHDTSIIVWLNFDNRFLELFIDFCKYGFLYELRLSVAFKISHNLLSPTQLRDLRRKIIEFLCMKGVLYSIELQMLRAKKICPPNFHPFTHTDYDLQLWKWLLNGVGLSHLLCSPYHSQLDRWNPKHPSYSSIWLFCNSLTL